MSTIGEILGTTPKAAKVPWKYEDQNLITIHSSELIGIEVEVENTRWTGESLRGPWEIKEDGSLRNDGREIVSSPISAADAPAALYYLLQKILSKECSFSMRTSIHIHLNATDMTEAEVRDFVAVYTIFEPALFNFSGRGRWKSVFCVPLTECNQIHAQSSRKFNDGRWEKYTSLNLRRLADLGTIEFRHMAGTFDVTQISNWIGMICRLKEFVKGVGTKEIRTLIAGLLPSSDYNGLCNRVFQEFAPLLNVCDPTVYYPSSLTSRECFTKPAVIVSAADSPLMNFLNSSRKRSN